MYEQQDLLSAMSCLYKTVDLWYICINSHYIIEQCYNGTQLYQMTCMHPFDQYDHFYIWIISRL